MSKKDYPTDVRSKVTVEFTDGEVKTYEVNAGPGIARYLAEEMARTRTLVLMDHDTSYCIPASNVRSFTMERVREESKGEQS